MKYHYKKKNKLIKSTKVYYCDHRIYNSCSLFLQNGKGLAVIQQRYNSDLKMTWWGPVDPVIASDIQENDRFQLYFDEKAKEPINGLYPTVMVRQIMWALRMKPLKSHYWESRLTKLD